MNKEGLVGIYPGFDTSTHNPVHKRLIVWKGAKPLNYHEAQREVFVSKQMLFALKFVKLYYYFLLLFKRDRISGLYYKGINILHSVVELTVVSSKDGRFKRLSKDAFKSINIAVQVTYNAHRLINSGRVALVVGGDEAFVYGSVWGQLAAKNKINHLYLKQREGFVSAFSFDLKTLFAGPRYYELGNNDQVVIDKKLLSEIHQVIEQGNYTYMRKVSLNKEEDLAYLKDSFILYLHDFLDSPGIFGHVFFFDLWEWIEMVLEASVKQKQKLVIKIHPNVSHKNKLAIARLRRHVVKYKNVIVTNDHFSLYDYRKQVKGVLTIFGTVMVEARQFDVPCLSAAINHSYICGNLVPRIESKEDFRKKLAMFFRGEELIDRSQKSDPALTYYLANYEPFLRNRLFEGLPYDDMTMDLFKKLHPTIQDVDDFGIHERRTIFLYSQETLTYMENFLDEHEEELKKRLNYLLSTFN